MLERLTGPDAISARLLAEETGVGQVTLSRWLREAPTLSSMVAKKRERRGAEGPRKWTGVEKFQIVLEAASVPDAELGEFLRRKGIHEADLKAWREVVKQSASDALEGGRKIAKHSASAERRIKELEQDVAKKDKRLKAVNALLELQKKVREIWGDAEESTNPRSEP
jgi:vacuolar-type H+-ATPase subunit I/STV1